jgi:hypothetical protein
MYNEIKWSNQGVGILFLEFLEVYLNAKVRVDKEDEVSGSELVT